MAHAVQNSRTVEELAKEAASHWQRAQEAASTAVDEALATGRVLAEARETKTDKEYGEVLQRAGIGVSKAKMLRQLADSAVGKRSLTSTTNLPQKWSVLAELAPLDEDQLSDAEKKGLLGPETTARSARAIAGAYSDDAGAVGEGSNPAMLPSPTEARRIARETERPVAGSDGNIHFPHTDERAGEIQQQRSEDYGVIRAVGHLAKVSGMKSPEDWWAEMPNWRRAQIDPDEVDAAINWLAGLHEVARDA